MENKYCRKCCHFTVTRYSEDSNFNWGTCDVGNDDKVEPLLRGVTEYSGENCEDWTEDD